MGYRNFRDQYEVLEELKVPTVNFEQQCIWRGSGSTLSVLVNVHAKQL